MTPLRIAASVLFLSAGTAIAATQTPSFSTRLEAVRVDVLVTDNGRIVRGLGPSDFEVRDNGVLQQVNLVSFEQIPLNVVLGLDMSESVSGERLDHLRSAGRALIDGLTATDRGGLVTFSHRVALRQDLTTDVTRLRSALDLVRPLGETSLVDGTYAAMMLGAADVGRGLLIVFSDGVDTSSWLSPDRVLESARHSDVVVYGVVVRASEGPTFLRDLSGLTGGTVLEVESTRDLAGRFVGVLNEFRQRYLVSYSPVGVSKAGWHRLDVRVKDRKASVKARAGYTGS